MRPPVTYQGAKTRIADATLDVMGGVSAGLVDVCCGSGAISLAAVTRGLAPERVTMVDAGPWGAFWHDIGAGTFDMVTLRDACDLIQSTRPEQWNDALKWLERTHPAFSPAVFLVLQAGAFGSKAVQHDGTRWRSPGYMRPSPRRGGLQPPPVELLSRAEEIAERMRGVCAFRSRAEDVHAEGVHYIDPPYPGTTGYGLALFDAPEYARLRGGAWIAHHAALSPHAWRLSDKRPASGIAGQPRAEEWLSWVGP